MKYHIQKSKIPIYFGSLWVIFTDDFMGVNEELKLGMGGDLNGYGALAFHKKQKGGVTLYMAIFDMKPDPKQISHEVVHIVNFVFKHRMIDLDINNDEPQAYFTGWVTGEIYRAMNKFKVPMYKA